MWVFHHQPDCPFDYPYDCPLRRHERGSKVTVDDRIAARVKHVGGHHIWQGKVDRNGIPITKHNSSSTTVRRLVWELAHGPLPPSARVLECPGHRLCVRLDHLHVEGADEVVTKTRRTRARKGTGSMRQVRPGTWELRVTAGRWSDGSVRTLYRTVQADDEADATAQLIAFVDEMGGAQHPEGRDLRELTVDTAIEQFLTEYLADEKGREEKTVSDYRKLHQRWFSPTIGDRRVGRVDTATMDRLFGVMRRAGLSASRLNQAKSLYGPFFRWAKRRGITTRNPMVDFQKPTSSYLSRERTPPEVDELSLLLSTAVQVVPEIAPLLVLGAVTGMRRGELVGIRRSRVLWGEQRITVDSAVSEFKHLKGTKTRQERSFHVDAETLEMLRRHHDLMDERARLFGTELCRDPFLFSLVPDCSKPIPPDYVTKRVGVLKGYLGIEEKRPDVLAVEDEALRLRRQPPRPRPRGVPGPTPKGGMSFREIGTHFGRSERWAMLAVAAAERREHARAAGLGTNSFDGSIVALRKFTSSELLDAGFNVSMIAQRQGHGPGVLTRHYSKSRASADKLAAEHLGRVVHGQRQP
jgi:integrase